MQNGARVTARRASSFNPDGVSYSDCMNDQSLSFDLSLSGFTGTDSAQVWVSLGQDCFTDANRNSTTAATCWPARANQDAPVNPTTQTTGMNFTLRLQDIIGPQGQERSPASYAPQIASACTTQPGPAHETFNIFFLPITSAGTFDASGRLYRYELYVDLVGPAAPTAREPSIGDTFLTANWTPNSDSDTVGYDVFLDPIRGQEATDASSPDSGPTLVCVDSGGPEASGDAGCRLEYVGHGASADAGSCGTDPILSGAIVLGTGSSGAADAAADGSGDGGATATPGSSGISTIPADYLVDANGGATVSDPTTGSYTITGLQNGTRYHVVVSAVDAVGNVGPASVADMCETPEPVIDFWHDYKAAGGGGGFCTVAAVGGARPSSAVPVAAVFVGAAGVVRRRRKGQPRASKRANFNPWQLQRVAWLSSGGRVERRSRSARFARTTRSARCRRSATNVTSSVARAEKKLSSASSTSRRRPCCASSRRA
jgi:hypothetical protein